MNHPTQHTPHAETQDPPAGRGSTPPEVDLPPQSHLEERLHAERLMLVRILSVGLLVLGAASFVAYLTCAVQSRHVGLLAVGYHHGLLAFAGLVSLHFCRRGRLREATYSVALPLISHATMSLALIAGTHGLAVINYCLVISIAALTLEGNDWPRLAVVIGVCALMGALLHCFPVVPQAQLPPWLLRGSLLVVTPLGLLMPMTLFWLYSTHLTASREEAWELARTTARANQLKTDFLSTMSHELRSPIHVIIGNTQMLREGAYGDLTAEQERTLRRMETYSIELLQLIQSALEVSRLESGRVPVHVEKFAVDDVIEEVIEGVSVAARQAGIELRSTGARGVGEMLTDRLKLKEILQNLATNAVKFTPTGHVEIRAHRHGDDVVFEVEDTGIGIPAEDLPLIFESFRQSQQADNEWLRGVGLGLFIVKRLAGLLRGAVTVESVLGEGSTFRVCVPIIHTTVEAQEAASDPAPVVNVVTAPAVAPGRA
jgi:signal transduction histidine kinase